MNRIVQSAGLALLVTSCSAPSPLPAPLKPQDSEILFAQAPVHRMSYRLADENPQDYYPDLEATVPDSIYLQSTNGQVNQLRFSNAIVNLGPGAFQLRGSLDASKTKTIATQEILDDNGKVLMTKACGTFAYHPSHHHFHVDDVSRYELHQGSADGPIVRSAKKVSFCMEDSYQAADGSIDDKYTTCTPTLQGISPGWADLYPGDLDGQSLNITGLEAGIYALVITVDPTNKFLDADRSDNVASVLLYIDPDNDTLEEE